MVSVGWDTSNLAVLTENGFVCESCCGYELGTRCGNCAIGETPKYLQVIISGVTDCTGCLMGPLCGVGDDYWRRTNAVNMAGSINGTYTLEQTEVNPCRWNYTIADTSSTLQWFNDLTCDPGAEFQGELTSISKTIGAYRGTYSGDESLLVYAVLTFNFAGCDLPTRAASWLYTWTGDECIKWESGSAIRQYECTGVSGNYWGYTQGGTAIVTAI